MTFRNRTPMVIWTFVTVWCLMLIAPTVVVVRDGAANGYTHFAAVMAFLWLCGAGAIYFALSKPCYLVTVEPGIGISVTYRYPFKVVRTSILRDHVAPPRVVEEDNDGPYFYARVKVADGLVIDIAEGNSRDKCERACQQFTETLHG